MSTRGSRNDTDATVELEVLKNLLGYGVLGIVSVLAVLFARYKDREARRVEEKSQVQLAALHTLYQERIEATSKDHRVEVEVLLERYISKAETWVEKYNEMARELRVLISAIRGQNSP